MHRGRPFRALAVVVAAALAASCATTRLPPISAAGAAFEPEKDEVRLWSEAREQERQLREKLTVYEDPLLGDYLDDIVSHLDTPGMRENPQLRYHVSVIDEPTLNAFAFPHGALYVHTGLLAQLENEDQLAMVLAHEMSHVENRHMLRLQRQARNRQIAYVGAAIGLAIVLGTMEGRALDDGHWGRAAAIDVLGNVVVGLGLGLVFLASINGYGRDLEAEADAEGFEKMSRAGYDVEEGGKVYEILMEDAPPENSRAQQYFFSTHPALADRVASTTEYLASAPPGGEAASPADPARFAKRIRPVLRHHVEGLVAAGEIARAERGLERLLDLDPDDPASLLTFGRVRVELAKQERDEAKARAMRDEARAAFTQALEAGLEEADARYELGLLAYRENDFRGACAHFRRFLQMRTDDERAARVRDYLRDLANECGDGP